MRNRLTFANIMGILLENKKKTYPQHQLVRSLFSAYLNDELSSDEIYAEDNTMYSRWCTGARPIPMEILRIYEENNFEDMEKDFRCKIIPNLINESLARSQTEELINDSRNTIGNKTADEMLAITDNAAFLTAAVRYAILSDHEHNGLFSPDLSDTIQNSRLPSIMEEFVGRKNELKDCGKLLQEHLTLFISGVAEIGKSEFAQNDFQLLITTRCHPTQYPIMELKELDADTELPELFFRLCPSSKEDTSTTKKIIQAVHSHTLTVVLSALSLSASGMEAEELLYELQTCGLGISSGEAVELYKAELFLIKNDYKNALKKRLKAVNILEPYHTEDADRRTANLLSNLYNNLSNMLVLSKNAEMAKQVLSAYESLVLEHEGTQTLDNGICQMMYGAVALSESKAKEAELHLLSAEIIITEIMGTDNDYAKTVYLYLNNLYSRWQKPEQTLAYKNKYLECSKLN